MSSRPPTENATPCVLLTGIPRSGTTLACELLNDLPDVRALAEPPILPRLPRRTSPDGEALFEIDDLHQAIVEFADEQRHSILERGAAITKHVGGRVTGTIVEDSRSGPGPRRSLIERGEIAISRPESRDFTLVIKHPIVFTVQLRALHERFSLFALVRNPLAVLGSWESMPWWHLREGSLRVPYEMAPQIADRLAGIENVLDRQLEMLGWFFEQYTTVLPRERVIRYEDLIDSRGRALSVIAASAAALDVPLAGRNSADVYDRAYLSTAGKRLLERAEEAPWSTFYPASSIEQLLGSLTG
jgi:Sulfotransferase family